VPESRISDVLFDHVSLEFGRWTKYPGEVFDNRPTSAYPDLEPHKTPAYSLRNADNVSLINCSVKWGTNIPDYFTNAIESESVTGLKLSNFSGKAAHPGRDEAIVKK